MGELSGFISAIATSVGLPDPISHSHSSHSHSSKSSSSSSDDDDSSWDEPSSD